MKRKTKMDDSHFVPIVSDGAIATGGTADGRAIPVLVVDCENHKEVLNLVHLHTDSPPGDVNCTWAAIFNPVVQMTAFKRPIYYAQFPAICQG
jgi:hypothetical protein